MKLICYGSSSRGNGYILQGESEVLLLEAGLPVSNVRKYVRDFRQIQGCLISHRHGDHCKFMGDFMKAGIKCYAHEDVWEHYHGSTVNQGIIFPPLLKTDIGGFQVIPMRANHDVPCYAYLIHHAEMGKLLFVTDSAGFSCTFSDLRHIMIECNWSEECIQQALEEGRIKWYVAKRSRETHMGLKPLLDYLQYENIAATANEVILLHLSHENSDANIFTQTVGDTLHKPVYVAENGFEIELTL